MYELTRTIVNVLFFLVAGATIITSIVKIRKSKKDKSDNDRKK